MLHTTNPIIKHKAGLLNLAEELGNVSKACKIMGFSRDTFYRYQELAQDGGVDALIDRNTAPTEVPLDLDIACAVGQIPRTIVPDMPDRIIAATAFHLGLPLVTRDSKIQALGILPTIW